MDWTRRRKFAFWTVNTPVQINDIDNHFFREFYKFQNSVISEVATKSLYPLIYKAFVDIRLFKTAKNTQGHWFPCNRSNTFS